MVLATGKIVYYNMIGTRQLSLDTGDPQFFRTFAEQIAPDYELDGSSDGEEFPEGIRERFLNKVTEISTQCHSKIVDNLVGQMTAQDPMTLIADGLSRIS